MSTLKIGEIYTLVEDFSGKKASGHVASFFYTSNRKVSVAIDVSQDGSRDVEFWGDIVAAVSNCPDLPIDNFKGDFALVDISKMHSVPLEGSMINILGTEGVGSSRGWIEGEFSD